MSKSFKNRLADVIRKPIITEKATNALDLNRYTFEVDHRAAKPDIKAAIESMFSGKVIAINTMNTRSKWHYSYWHCIAILKWNCFPCN